MRTGILSVAQAASAFSISRARSSRRGALRSRARALRYRPLGLPPPRRAPQWTPRWAAGSASRKVIGVYLLLHRRCAVLATLGLAAELHVEAHVRQIVLEPIRHPCLP